MHFSILGQLPPEVPQPHPWLWLVLLIPVIELLYFLFWAWMLYDCYRNEPDRQTWLWVMIVFQGVGPVAYFVLRYFPNHDLGKFTWFTRFFRGSELQRLEGAARQIGNAHQFIQWGDALRDCRKWKQAGEAYAGALKKEPKNLQALWGAALTAVAENRHDASRDFTARILEMDRQYKFGDTLLTHARSLSQTSGPTAARGVWEEHAHRWRHPESMYRLAEIEFEAKNLDHARELCETLIIDLNSSPRFFARKNGRWKSRAKQLLKKLRSAPR